MPYTQKIKSIGGEENVKKITRTDVSVGNAYKHGGNCGTGRVL